MFKVIGRFFAWVFSSSPTGEFSSSSDTPTPFIGAYVEEKYWSIHP